MCVCVCMCVCLCLCVRVRACGYGCVDVSLYIQHDSYLFVIGLKFIERLNAKHNPLLWPICIIIYDAVKEFHLDRALYLILGHN
jgi:hypothetical protein